MLVQIEQQLDSLSRTERKVGAWVLAHPRDAAAATLREVAEATGASEPTVIRFCRSIGLRGFRELALRLTEALSRPDSYLHAAITEDDAAIEAATKVLDASIQALLDVRNELAGMPLEPAVAALSGARQIVFAGLGASGHVAADAEHKFFRLGIPCSALGDAPALSQFASIAAPGDALVLVSHTGNWPELVASARLARQRGATVVALTNPDSALAGVVDLLLPCRVVEDTNVYTPMSSRLAQLALLDALQIGLALAIGEPAVTRLRDTKRALALIKAKPA